MKKVLVTGASRGLGKELVKELNRRGYEVIASARNVKDWKNLKEFIKFL